MPTWLTASSVYKLYKTLIKTTFRVWCFHSYLVDGVDQPGCQHTQHMTTTILAIFNSFTWNRCLQASIPQRNWYLTSNRFRGINALGSLKVLKSGLNYTARTAHNVCDPNYRLIKIFSILQWPNLLLCVCIFFVSFCPKGDVVKLFLFIIFRICVLSVTLSFNIL